MVYLATNLLQFFIEYVGEKFLKIGQYLAKIWAKVCGLLVWPTL